jgi:hypothetical protein
VICLAPRAPGESVRPRRLSGVVMRPLNFTVRCPMSTFDGVPSSGAKRGPDIAAYFLLGLPIPAIFWTLQFAFRTFEPTLAFAESLALRLFIPLLMLAWGVALLFRIRSIDSLTYICLAGIIFIIALCMAGLFALTTGYAFSRYVLVPVSRLYAIPYFILAAIVAVVTAVAIAQNNRRRNGTPNNRWRGP